MRKADWNPLTPLSGCGVVWRHTGQVIKCLSPWTCTGKWGKAVVTERVEDRAASWAGCSDPDRLDRSAAARDS